MSAVKYKFSAEELIFRGRIQKKHLEELRDWLSGTGPTTPTTSGTTTAANSVPQVVPVAPPIQLTDELLAIFLISCDSEVAATMRTICAYHRCRCASPDIFRGRNLDADPALQQIMRTLQIASIPQRTAHNEAVHFFRLVDAHYAHFGLVAAMKVSYMLLDVTHHRWADPPDGLIVVIDAKGMSLMHLTLFKRDVIRRYIDFLQEAFPLKLKAIHVVNTATIAQMALNVFKMFMKGHILDMLHLHAPGTTSWSSTLNAHNVPPSCLPAEYGGTLASISQLHECTIHEFAELRDFFAADESNFQ